jgi:hypothetical protein
VLLIVSFVNIVPAFVFFCLSLEPLNKVLLLLAPDRKLASPFLGDSSLFFRVYFFLSD